eukprot:TRINITY_DN35969_c0_g1_i2.p3 TRINITY_DN35969_c0_g1~~TRINITY_DN35969_c0_g1_i2.p3  ORF type:complete len:104 (-),score=0.29 TRINITY_DN35969_c0_g1_i2:36-347(-)
MAVQIGRRTAADVSNRLASSQAMDEVRCAATGSDDLWRLTAERLKGSNASCWFLTEVTDGECDAIGERLAGIWWIESWDAVSDMLVASTAQQPISLVDVVIYS